MKIACKMKPLLLLIAILLVSCAGPQYKKIVASELKTLDDFAKAKDQLADNYLYEARDFDLNVVNYAEEYVLEARKILVKLSIFDSNIVLLSVEESELLTLALIAKNTNYDPYIYGESLDSNKELSPTDYMVNQFLQAINNHNSNIEKQKTKKILNGNSPKTEKSLAAGIFFNNAKKNIISQAFSDEERDIMLLYSQFLMIKYRFSFRQELYEIGEFRAFDNGEEWLYENKTKFLRNHPNTKYRPFLDAITLARTTD